jgi:hypothetical protein
MRRAVVALLMVMVAAGCSRRSSGKDFVPPHYPDGAAGLQQLWGDILEAARKDDREHVHDLMATTILSDEELRRLLGPRAEALLPRYHQLMAAMVNRGAVELVGQIYEHKYDAVETFADENDAAVAAALIEPHPLWSVRVRKAAESRGLRYDCFLYLDGRWRTGNQLGKFIEPAAPKVSDGKAGAK